MARHEMKRGGYGFHKIWKNLDRLLSPIGVAQVKANWLGLKPNNAIAKTVHVSKNTQSVDGCVCQTTSPNDWQAKQGGL